MVALLEEMFERNDVDHDDLISILFTATDDIHCDVPGHGGPRRSASATCRCSAPGARRRRAPRRCASGCMHPPRDRASPRPSCTTCTSRAPPASATTFPDVSVGAIRQDRARRSSAPASSAARSAWRCAGQGWHVTGVDRDPARAAPSASRCGALDADRATDPDGRADLRRHAGRRPSPTVSARRPRRRPPASSPTSGSVKAPIVRGRRPIPRFVGGHPMAGSEQDGVDGGRRRPVRGRDVGADPDGRHRRRRPTPPCGRGRPTFGAEVVALAPDRHDALVAVVSHVPHLTAATLMGLADERVRASTGPCCAWPPAASAT